MTALPLRLIALAFDDATSLDRAVEALRHAPAVREMLRIRTCQRFELFVLCAGEIDDDALRAPDRPVVRPSRPHDWHGRDARATRPAEWAASELKDRFAADGVDAALRLFRIAAGVLSDIPGERAVAEQLRRQLREALRRREAGTILAKLTRRALRSGEALRATVQPRTPILELADLIANDVREVMRSRASDDRGVVLLGGGAMGREIHAALTKRGVKPSVWATRRPRTGPDGPGCTIREALNTLQEASVLVTALSGAADGIDAAALPPHLITIDLGVPRTIRGAMRTLRDVIDRHRAELQPQADAVARAAHRLPARAEAAWAEVLCPSIASVNGAIARFRSAIVDAEHRRLAAALDRLHPDDAERLRRSIRHTAARCLHPLHEYVNALGRQGRIEEARTVVDHLLGSRIGWSDPPTEPMHSAHERDDA